MNSWKNILKNILEHPWPEFYAREFYEQFKTNAEDADLLLKYFLEENPYKEPTPDERKLIRIYGPGDSVGKLPIVSISIFLHLLKNGYLPTQEEFATVCQNVWKKTKWWKTLSEKQRTSIVAKASHRFWGPHIGQIFLMLYLQKDLEKYNCEAFINSRLDLVNNNDVNIKYGSDLQYGIGYRLVGKTTTLAEKKRGLKIGNGIWYNIDIPLCLRNVIELKPRLKKYRTVGNLVIPAPWDIDHIRRDMIYDIIALNFGEKIKPINERIQYYVAKI